MRITVNGKKYRINSQSISVDCNYCLAISIFRIGEKMPLTGSLYKENDNVKEIATRLIKKYENYVHSNSL